MKVYGIGRQAQEKKKKISELIFAKLFITEARKQSLKTKVAKNIIQDTDASTAANV